MTEIPKGTNVEAFETERKRLLDLSKATTVLLSDSPQTPVDAVFFFGRSFFDAEKQGIFKDIADLIKTDRAKFVFLPDTEGERVGETTPRVSNPGKSLQTDRLVKLGINPDRVVYSSHLSPGEHGFNTLTEAEAFLETLSQKGLKTAVAITQPHQIVRAMLGVVRTINANGLSADVWSMVPQSTNWNKRVKGSQGMELKPRIDHIQDEIDRIFRYQAKGDIASFEELFAYLAKRDNQQSLS